MKTIKVEEIASRLNEIKEERRLNTASLADYGKTTFQTMGQMLKGNVAKPNMLILQNICQGIGLSEEWLLYGIGEKFSANQTVSTENPYYLLYLEVKGRFDDKVKELDNLRYTINLQRKLLGDQVNFNFVTSLPQLDEYSGIYKLPKYQYFTSGMSKIG